VLAVPTAVPTKPLPKTYDRIFKQQCRGIPVPFLRALAKNESGFNPHDTKGPAWGLLQVVEVVRREHNQRSSVPHSRQELLNPRINAKVACGLIKRIVRLYEQWHPDIFPVDWTNKNHVALVVFGWNAGYSKAKGVGYLLYELKARGETASAINIYHLAQEDEHASRFLRMAGRLRWTMRVVQDYFHELDLQKS